jgi:transcription elongation GreA/GreB family factor
MAGTPHTSDARRHHTALGLPPMSRAFVKEPDGETFEALPDRPLSPHPNFVTAQGLAAIEGQLAALDAAHAAAVRAADKAAAAAAQRDLRYWTARRASAQVVEPPESTAAVQFGSAVSIRRDDGRTQTFRIVGEDEADPSQGTLSHVAPLARALFGKSAGDVVDVGGSEIEIVKID